MRNNNMDYGLSNDFISDEGNKHFDHYEMNGFTPSASMQLDVIGRQPHSREYLEYETMATRSERKFQNVEGQTIDYCEGIQFTGKP